MDISEVFRQILVVHLKMLGWGSQKALADAIGVGTNHLNGFLRGNKPMSEAAKERIARHYGYEYLDFILWGRKKYLGEAGEQEATAQQEVAKAGNSVTSILSRATTAQPDDLLPMFKNPDIAKDIVWKMLKLERISPKHMILVHDMMTSLLGVASDREIDSPPFEQRGFRKARKM